MTLSSLLISTRFGVIWIYKKSNCVSRILADEKSGGKKEKKLPIQNDRQRATLRTWPNFQK